ncbi:Uncharacterised protein r2_g1986 [Pycnogonum litorale]
MRFDTNSTESMENAMTLLEMPDHFFGIHVQLTVLFHALTIGQLLPIFCESRPTYAIQCYAQTRSKHRRIVKELRRLQRNSLDAKTDGESYLTST